MRNYTNQQWYAILLFSICISYFSQSQTVIDSENFETGWGIWNDGGSDCDRTNSGTPNGTYSINIQDNSGTSSSMTTNDIDITSYGSIEISFDYETDSMENNEDFWVRYSSDGGSNWSTISTYVSGTDFNNGTSYTTTATINSGAFTFSSNSQFRVQCDASSDGDDVYIDNISITGYLPQPEINILGNTIVTILDGNTTPSLTDKTDFGYIDYNSGSTIKTYTIQNIGSSNLSIGAISITGANAGDFSVSTAPSSLISPGNNTTISITFNPSSIGLKTATLSIVNNDTDENPYDFAIQGTGVQTFFDSDNDGVLDNIDIDDDNDGILDTDEENNCSSSNGHVVNYKFLNETFGTGTGRATINTNNYAATTTYCYEDGIAGTNTTECPSQSTWILDDGEYTVVSKITGTIASDPENIHGDLAWYNGEDHTTGDINGRMAVFNASFTPGVFYETTITGVLSNLPITYSFWALNIMTQSNFTGSILPDITVEFLDLSNNTLATYNTGEFGRCSGGITDNSCVQGEWQQFTTSVNLGNVNAFTVRFINNAPGGGGNDLALDDIVISQTLCDTDNDGIADLYDLDSDNDGIPDVVEAGLGNYSDGNATLTACASWVDTNTNGMHDLSEGHIILNSDNDGTPNYLDLDSDNDTIFDVDESGATNSGDVNYQNGDGDITGDGVGDGTDTDNVRETDIDSDNVLEHFSDGILDIYDFFNGGTMATAYGNSNQGSTGAGWEYYVADTDNDGTPDYIDITSDGSTFDISHTLYANLDSDNDGLIDDTSDAESDGIVDLFDTDDTTFGSPRDLNRKLQLFFDGRNDYAEEPSIISAWSEISLMAWVKTDPTANGSRVIVGESNFYLRLHADNRLFIEASGTNLNSSNSLPTNQWVHVASTYNSTSGLLKLYVNGEEVASTSKSGNLSTSSTPFTIGKSPNTYQNYFKGFIDEVRLFNKGLSENELQKMVHQEITNNAGVIRGDIIPKDINDYDSLTETSTPLNWISLERYYKMDIYKDDIIDDLSTNSIDIGSGCKIFNTKVIDVQTAPLPFVTTVSCSGDWTDTNNWIQGDIWNVTGTHTEAAIVHIQGNMETNSNHSMIGLILDNGSKLEVNGDSGLFNSWYLKLDGAIDLQGESQLIQKVESSLDLTSSGTLERDQQGTKDLYTYNYWSSPVGVSNTTSNNNSYTLPDVLSDGTIANTPLPITFVSGHNGTPGVPGTTSIGIAGAWIWKYANKLTDDYASWQHVKNTGTLFAGEGYTMKGVDNSATSFTEEQNYVFNGKPHNGDITLTLSAGNDYLVGNPYASAIDGNEFILDNINDGAGRATTNIIDGTLYFWDHFAGNTHVLREYQGGYATYTLIGGIKAVSTDARINASGQIGTKVPQQYIPVSQGFFVTADAGGTVTFKNSQRAFKTEASDPSLFLRGKKGKSNTAKTDTDDRQKIRLMLDSPKGYHRQLLVGIDPYATNDIDKGYDAPLIENNVEDLFWIFNDKNFVIQAVNNFDDNQILPLGVKINQEGLATIKIDELENIDSDKAIYLHDKELNLYHDLKENKYDVHLAAGEYLNRFELTFSKASESLSTDEANKNPIEVYFSNDEMNVVIHNPNSQLIESVEMINILGQSLFKFKIKSNDDYLKYKASQMKTGAYILKIETEYGKLSKKVLIN
ncbi:hypothetical protein BFR04_10570 [Gaetbulibacter sp. 4G1]|nr:LamG-like jellyroll fold domain-containing protein [Gaetbulibacter sp. 4G1]PIA82202.1 hypothetical protein BFR04_10570 [Gaetbulibacter sp. 4G1]